MKVNIGGQEKVGRREKLGGKNARTKEKHNAEPREENGMRL